MPPASTSVLDTEAAGAADEELSLGQNLELLSKDRETIALEVVEQ